jgi:putative ABC transport system permease protein
MLNDLRFAFRQLLKNPGFTAVAVFTLALGIGANTAIFSAVNAVLLRSLPVAKPDQLVMVYETRLPNKAARNSVAPSNFLAWREQQSVFEDIAAFFPQSFAFTSEVEAELLNGARVSGNLFALLRAGPSLGRAFLPEEDHPDGVRSVILSHGLWRRRFNATPNVIEQTLMLDGKPCIIIGVMPEGFGFPLPSTELWLSAGLDAQRGMDGMSGRILSTIARLKPGMTIDQARAQMNLIAQRMSQESPSFNADLGVNVVPLKEVAVEKLRPILLALAGAVGFVLLIACANVASLLLARAAAREREIAIRGALGASRWRVLRPLLLESLLLAVLGGGLGLLLALWSSDVLVALSPGGILREWKVSIDPMVLAFTLAVSLLTGLLFGLAPAVVSCKPDCNESLKEGSRGSTSGANRHRLRSLLVVSEVALSLVLLVGAGLMVRSFLRLQNVDPGFDPNQVLTLRLSLPEARYVEAHQVIGFYQQLAERLGQLPGVQSVGATHALPLGGSGGERPFLIEGRPSPEAGKEPAVQYRLISPGYFRTMRIPLISGRDFTEQDQGPAAGVVIINRTFARRYFPNEDPVGNRITLGGYPELWGEITGVVGDVRHWWVGSEAEPEMYWAYSQAWLARSATLNRLRRSLTLVLRTKEDAGTLVNQVRREVAGLDKALPISNLKTMNEWLAGSLVGARFNALLIGVFASLALLLAAIGVYGVMSYSVSQRTNEIGIRMALGAQKRNVLSLVIGQGMRLGLMGVGIGVVTALALMRVMTTLLFEVDPADPLTFVGVSVLLVGIVLFACWLPARRAARVDPMEALRHE